MSGEGSLFDLVAAALETATGFDALAARGTLRIALKNAGLDPKTVNAEQMVVAVDRLLAPELETRGVRDPAGVCRALAEAAQQAAPSGAAAAAQESPEAIFRRMREGSAG